MSDVFDGIINELSNTINKITEDEISNHIKGAKVDIADFDEAWLKDDLSTCMDHNNTLFYLKELKLKIIILRVKQFRRSFVANEFERAAVETLTNKE